MIFEDIPMAKLIEKRLDYYDEMTSFIDEYQEDITKENCQRIYNNKK